ncbi:carbohydrate porin [Burkholderia vietnamiensis]|uniref:carbohydrate porin n=1 Tax=Burkholderia vietnamiensis TaxID=60552 RepID=UPI001593A872|nr:carbohydrate porin [Burkholderia vietnamiensis]MBR8003169.1 carbohydrate porin [Burkholderia vietnamiensis]MCA7944838.1 carbohydrate porin [Burkholderia vietnamiensis]HDR8969029.1 carbohydrate porin [Burkholderia vietnamiensis]HDR9143868.1 carbohydrate porin [Burkholderia vietnamiensis]HDR9220338.1 carbohydrate porin [Burkholderia vietnamiensis]
MKNHLEPVARKPRLPAFATLLLSLASAPALAQSLPPAAAPEPAAGASGAAAPAQAADAAEPTGLWERSNLFGNIGGLRDVLGEHGVTLNLQETSEYLYNAAGGTQRGGAYQGLTQFGFTVDAQKAIGLPGGTFNVSGLQIHGTNLTSRYLQTLQTATGIEANSTTRLWELWYQQAFFDGKADVRIGQQSVDQEFMVSQYAATFINSTFGWPVLPATDLPAGGPAYPLSSLGVRLRVKPADAWTAMIGVYDGNAAGRSDGDAQTLNAHGTNFNLRSGAFVIGELQYALNAPSSDPKAPPSAGLPGTYKIGFWYQTQHANDPRVGTDGLSLANPASNGIAATHHGNYGFYAGADQMIWRPAPDSPRSVGVFARVMGAPGDRNIVDFAANAGITLKAPFRGRDDDTAGIAIGYTKIGSHARALDGDTGTYQTPGYPVRRAETVIEATYQYQVAPWWQLQADLQHFFRPGGGIPNPNAAGARIGDETVIGVRTTITF